MAGFSYNPLSGFFDLVGGGMSIGGAIGGSTAYAILSVSATNTLTELGPLTDGQLLIGATGGPAIPATLTGTINQLVITNGSGSITLSLPQDIATTSSPTFAGLTLTGFSGPVKATAGVLSSSPINLASTEVTNILTVNKGGTGLDGSSAANGSLLIGNGSGYTLTTLTGTTNQVNVTNASGSITLSLPQDISTTSSPTFNSLTLTTPLTIANGGTGASTQQAAINALVSTVVNGTYLRGNGTNAIMSTLQSGDIITGLGYTPENIANKGVANGYAPLDGGAKVPVAYLPSSIMLYIGNWDPSTNTPALSDGTGTNGNVYYITTAFAGPIVGLNNASMHNFQIGDIVIYSSSLGQWELTTPAAGVQSVNGAQGVVTLVRGNLSELTSSVLTVTGGANSVWGGGTSIQVKQSGAAQDGYLSSIDWNTFNNKQNTLTFGNLTDVGTDGITITNGTNSVIGTGTSISQHVSDSTHNGYLSSADWSTFNNKVTSISIASTNGFAGSSSGGSTPTLTISTAVTGVLKGNGTAISAAVSGTDYSAGTSGLTTGLLKSTTGTGILSIAVAGTDYQTPITQGNLTSAGDITVTGGTNSVIGAGTTVNLSPTGVIASTYNNATIAVDSKGRITSASSGTFTPADINPTQWNGLANNTANQTVVGLVFASTVSTFECLMNIRITATSNLWTTIKIYGTREASSDWSTNDCTFSYTGTSITGLNFSINTSGQVLISVGNISGFAGAVVGFRAITLS